MTNYDNNNDFIAQMPISPTDSSSVTDNSNIFIKTERGYDFELAQPKKKAPPTAVPKLDFSRLQQNNPDIQFYCED